MAEASRFWTTSGTGDGPAGGYTAAQFAEFVRQTLMTDLATEGVLKGIGNELATTGTSSPVSTATGSGIVYGFYYASDSAVTTAIPTPTTATRIDRIVLRTSWAAQTIRITRIAGTEGAGTPALTQIANTTWDIPLATVSITTGGVITVTDARTFIKTPGTFGYLDDSNIINAAQLASNSVTTAKIADLNVTEGKLATGAVTVTKIGAGAVTSAKLATGAVVTTSILDDAITSAKIAANTITGGTTGNIATNTITATEIASGAIGSDELAGSAVIEAKIGTGAVTNGKIATGAVTGGVSAGVATGSIAVNTIVGGTTGNIAFGTITADNIAANAVTNAKINASAVTNAKIAIGEVTGGTSGGVATGSIAELTITAGNIADGAITNAKIGALAVTGAKIASTTITAANIASNTITANEIAAGAIGTSELSADSVTGAAIGEWAVKFGGRQGGNSDNWSPPGTTEYKDPISSTYGSEVLMCSGSIQISISSAASGTANVTFHDKYTSGSAYASNPILVATSNGSADYIIDVSSISISGATIRATHKSNTSATTTVTVWWIALGTTGL